MTALTSSIRTRAQSSRAVRSDIQGVRAIAVGVVVIYHLWPSRLPGGFVGVDIFFVISGFLITSHILRATSTAKPWSFLSSFYARRIRRLAPAAVVVLLAVLAATVAFMPVGEWEEKLSHVFAAALFVENWHLAALSVDYLASDAAPSALQHFWSLSVEEQFYIAWPIMILIAALLGWGQRRILLTIALIAIVSLAFSLWATATDPSPAYFMTPARVWQLAAGALATFVAIHSRRIRDVLPWLGISLIAVSVFIITSTTPYPGLAAILPTAGAFLILIGGGTPTRWSFDGLSSWRPVRALGDISYSLYLWHWPLIVLLPIALGVDLNIGLRVLILALSALLGWLSYRFIETPFRSGARDSRSARVFTAGAVALALVLVPSGVAVAHAQNVVNAASAELQESIGGASGCDGAQAIVNGCEDEHTVSVETAAAAGEDRPTPWVDDCINGLADMATVTCDYGNPDGAVTVLLWGDSHAAAWAPAFDAAGEMSDIRVIVATRHGCPSTLVAPIATDGRAIPAVEQSACDERNHWVAETLLPAVDRVVLANMSTNYTFQGRDAEAYGSTLEEIAAASIPASILADVPLTGDDDGNRVDGPECLSSGEACTNDIAEALSSTLPDDLIEAGYGDLYTLIPTSDAFCDDTECYFAIGGVSVYFDASHLSNTYSRSLGYWLSDHLADTGSLDG